MMRHKRSQVDHERFIKILEKEKAELEESLTEMEARLILVLRVWENWNAQLGPTLLCYSTKKWLKCAI